MSEEPILPLSRRSRRLLATITAVLAALHLVFPALAIDGVFLGLLALAVVILRFDIKSIDVFGVKATAQELKAETQHVRAAKIPESTPGPLPTPPAPTESTVTTTEHHEPIDLMPPTNPIARVLWSVEQIRIELIVLAGNRSLLTDGRPWDAYRPVELAELLSRHKVVPSQMITAIRSVVEQRNLLAHARLASLDLLKPLDELAVTREYIRVRQPEVPLYRDRSLTARHALSPGVAIEQRDKDGKLLIMQVFPTARIYTRYRFVTWEWDSTRTSKEEAWYVNSATNSPELAFSASASFAGREYPEQWGLEFRGGPLLNH